MAQETIITNVGEDDKSSVASEATLIELVSAVEKMAKAAGYDPASTRAKVEKALVESTKVNIKESTKYSDSLKEKTKATDKATESVSRMSRAFGFATAVFGGIVGAGTNLVKTFIEGGDTLTDFAQHIPLVGNQLSILTGLIDSAVSSFRQLSGAGISFGESIFEARRMAAEAGMTLERFSRVVQENSTNLALLRGSTNQGARAFADISKIIADDFRNPLLNLGLELDEIADFTASYLNQQIRLGRAQRMDARQLAEGTNAYIMQLDRLARLTGRQREEIARGMEEQMRDRRIAALLRTMAPEAQRELQAVLEGIEDADLREAVTEMVATGGVPLSEAAQGLVSQFPEFGVMSQQLRDGEIGFEEFAAGLRRNAEGVEQFYRENGRTAAAISATGSALFDLFPAVAALTNFGLRSAEVSDEQSEALERQEGALLQFSASLERIRNEFFIKIEPLLPRIVQGFSDVISFLTRSDVIDSFMDAVGRVVDFLLGPDTIMTPAGEQTVDRQGGFIDRMIADIEEKGIGQYLLDLIGTLGSTLMEGAIDAITEGIKGLWEHTRVLDYMLAGIAALWAGRALTAAMTAGISSLFARTAPSPRTTPGGVPGGGTESRDRQGTGTESRDRQGRGRFRLGRGWLPIAMGLTALELFNIARDDELSRDERTVAQAEAGGGLAGGLAGAAVGQTLIPIPILGALIGGTLGYMGGRAAGGALGESFTGTELSEEERIRQNLEAERQMLETIAATSGITTRDTTDRLREIDDALGRLNQGLELVVDEAEQLELNRLQVAEERIAAMVSDIERSTRPILGWAHRQANIPDLRTEQIQNTLESFGITVDDLGDELAERIRNAGIELEDQIDTRIDATVGNFENPYDDAILRDIRRNLETERAEALQEAAAVESLNREQQDRLLEINNQLEIQTEATNSLLDRVTVLNTIMSDMRDTNRSILELERQIKIIAEEELEIQRDIERNTDGVSGDISRRGITSF